MANAKEMFAGLSGFQINTVKDNELFLYTSKLMSMSSREALQRATSLKTIPVYYY